MKIAGLTYKLVATLTWAALMMPSGKGFGQSAFFTHLNTSNGLSDNNVKCLAVDNSGFLWIGTSSGLNVFDGYTVSVYYKEQVKEIPSDKALHLLCDANGRIWLGTTSGVAWIDNKRNFHRITLLDSINTFSCPAIVETKAYGIVLFTNKGQYYLNKDSNKWEKIEWIPKTIRYEYFMDADPFSDDIIIYTSGNQVVMLDYARKQTIYEQSFISPVSACRIDDRQIGVALETGIIKLIDITIRKQTREFSLELDMNGKKINTTLSQIRKASNNIIVAASGLTGLVVIDSSGVVSDYTHDPLDMGSISANNLYRALPGRNGEIITGAFTSGVSLFNLHYQGANYKKIFSDGNGRLFDNYVNKIEQDSGGVFWLGAYDRLIRWDRKRQQTDFFYYYNQSDSLGIRSLEIKTLCFDRLQQLWASVVGEGLALFTEGTNKFKRTPLDVSGKQGSLSNTVNDIISRKDGSIWVGTDGGIYAVDPVTKKARQFYDHPLLKSLYGNKILDLFEDSQERLWIGVQSMGAFCYDHRRGTMIRLSKNDGLLENICQSFGEDKLGNIYIATPEGFNMVAPDGKISAYNKSNGLRYNRCDGFLTDDLGNMWIANNKCVIKFEPSNARMQYFEQNAGIGLEGFRIGSGFKSQSGELFWGRWSGINYYFPAQLLDNSPLLQVSIFQVSLGDSLVRLGSDNQLTVPYKNNDLTFHFTGINLRGSANIMYEYMLENLDKDWQKGQHARMARYPSLRPGKYVFKARASSDGINWINSVNEVKVAVNSPIWQRWWFIALAVLLESALIYWFLRFRSKRLLVKEKLKADYERKLAEIEMKALRAQMNPHFIFNCLNSINRYIIKSDHATASLYLTRFAKLIRLILDNSNSKNVLLANEVEALKLYIEMESLRFDNKFTYQISVEEGVHPDVTEVPSMIIQPYVENAIWHGLLHKESGGRLQVGIRMQEHNILQCVVEDNGIGREKSGLLKSKTATKKSLGMKITEDRINMLNEYAAVHASIEVKDVRNSHGEIEGTKVIINIPV